MIVKVAAWRPFVIFINKLVWCYFSTHYVLRTNSMLMDLKNIKRAIEQVSEEKGIDSAKVLEAIESSIAAAYKKEYEKKGEIIKAKFDLKTGELKFAQIKTVVDETTVRMDGAEDEEAQAS